jgi:hypothetical protein
VRAPGRVFEPILRFSRTAPAQGELPSSGLAAAGIREIQVPASKIPSEKQIGPVMKTANRPQRLPNRGQASATPIATPQETTDGCEKDGRHYKPGGRYLALSFNPFTVANKQKESDRD